MEFKTRNPPRTCGDRRSALAGKQALLGFDGFVDTIVTPVAMRAGQGENFTLIGTITEFGQRILGAAGKSTEASSSIRAWTSSAGNGPIMANALLAQGAPAPLASAPSASPRFIRPLPTLRNGRK